MASAPFPPVIPKRSGRAGLQARVQPFLPVIPSEGSVVLSFSSGRRSRPSRGTCCFFMALRRKRLRAGLRQRGTCSYNAVNAGLQPGSTFTSVIGHELRRGKSCGVEFVTMTRSRHPLNQRKVAWSTRPNKFVPESTTFVRIRSSLFPPFRKRGERMGYPARSPEWKVDGISPHRD